MDRYDVAVVGGGLLGCATAHHLARAGSSVVLLEKDQLNRHASGQNAGSLHFQLEYRMVADGTDAAARAARALPLHLDAQRAWAGLAAELAQPVGVAQHGGLMLAETPDELDRLGRKAALERRYGLDVTVRTGAELRALAPYLSDTVLGASYAPAEGKANPRLVTLAYARSATRAGATIHTGTRLVGLTHAAGGWRLTLDDGRVLAATAVVIAAGVWTAEVAAMADIRLPVIPVALSMTVTAPAPPLLPHLIQHVGRRLSMKQSGDGNVLIGGGWPAKFRTRAGHIDLDAAPDLRYESLAGNADAARVVPAVLRLPVLRCWSGATTLTPDQLPVLGEIPRRPGLFAATGGSAFTLGPTYARLLAETMLSGAPSLPIGEYSPARFGFLNFV